MKHDRRSPVGLRTKAALAIGLACLIGAAPASAVTITIYNADGAGEGFNSGQPRTPVGGNPGTTLGAQRRFVFDYAADVWSARLGGGLPVLFTGKFNPMGGDQFSATLGFAAPTTLHQGFAHSPFPQSWYPAALANQYYGTDINDLVPANCPANALPLVNGKCPDLRAEFNSDVDGAVVLGGHGFYYGIDGKSGADVDFLTVVLHEMGHGLGLLDLIDPDTGRIWTGTDSCQTCSDAYSNNLEDPNIATKKVSQMTNAQRLQAITDTGKLVWVGPAVKAISDRLDAGRRSDGAVQVYAPAEYEYGSSVAHLSTVVSPSELMEPAVFNPPPRDLGLTLAMLDDVGWQTFEVASCGDANEDGNLTTSDALAALATAVGSGDCEDLVCDVNLAGGVTTGDALIILKRAVGQSVTLTCPLV